MPTNEEEQPNEFKDIYDDLISQIPKRVKVDFKSEKSSEAKLASYNSDIVTAYLNGENAHLERQRPISIILAIIICVQLVAMNVFTLLLLINDGDIKRLELLLDFMKYYTGAVIVEMIGLGAIVVKSVYSISLGTMVEHIIKKK